MKKVLLAVILLISIIGIVVVVIRLRGGGRCHIDGISLVEVTTSTGVVKVVTGLDTPEKFGHKIDADDLIALVSKRNRMMNGKPEVSYRHETTRWEYKVMLAGWLLGNVKEPKAFPHLLELVEDPFFIMRGWATTALQSFGDRRALPTLIRLLREKKPCNGALVQAIGALGDNSAVPTLIETIPAGGARNAEQRLKAIEEITGFSLAKVREEWGLVYYGEKHADFLAFMRKWWQENEARSRNGRTAEPAALPDS